VWTGYEEVEAALLNPQGDEVSRVSITKRIPEVSKSEVPVYKALVCTDIGKY